MAITERGQEESKGPALFTVFLFLFSVQIAGAFRTIPVGKHVIELSAAFISQAPNLLATVVHGSVRPNLLPSPNPASASGALFHFLHHEIRRADCAFFSLSVIIVALSRRAGHDTATTETNSESPTRAPRSTVRLRIPKAQVSCATAL
jgi:hypothetical protein